MRARLGFDEEMTFLQTAAATDVPSNCGAPTLTDEYDDGNDDE